MTAGRLAGVLWVAAITAVVTAATPTIAAAGDWAGDANLFFGRKALSGGWSPANRPSGFGAQVSWGKKEWPMRIATDLLMASETKTDLGTEVKSSTSELDFGFRKIWDKAARLHPFFGGGMALLTGRLKTTSGGVSEEDRRNGSGVWADGGVFWRLGPRFDLGADVRLSSGVVKFSGAAPEPGGYAVGVLAGWSWPAGK